MRKLLLVVGFVLGAAIGWLPLSAQVNNPGLTFPQLATPPPNTALGSSGYAFDALTLNLTSGTIPVIDATGLVSRDVNLTWDATLGTVSVINVGNDGSNFIQGFSPALNNGSVFGVPSTLAGGMSPFDPVHGGLSFTAFTDGEGQLNFTAISPTTFSGDGALIYFGLYTPDGVSAFPQATVFGIANDHSDAMASPLHKWMVQLVEGHGTLSGGFPDSVPLFGIGTDSTTIPGGILHVRNPITDPGYTASNAKIVALFEGRADQVANLTEWKLTGGSTLASVSPTGAGNFAALSIASAAVATQTYVNAQGFTTLAAVDAQKLSVFAATTSAELAGVISNETGSGLLVFGTAPALTGPVVITEAVGSSALTVTGATQITSFPALNITQTWNASGQAFTAVKVNATSTASAAGSLLQDWQLGGASKASIRKDGTIFIGGTNLALFPASTTSLDVYVNGAADKVVSLASTGIVVSDNLLIGWGDVGFRRDKANVASQRVGTAAQNWRVYNTFTTIDSAGEWLKHDWITTANQIRIGAAKGSSTGTARVLSIDYGGTEASPSAAITIPITSGDITFGGTLAPTGYKSSDGTVGLTATCTILSITSFTVKNGLITACS